MSQLDGMAIIGIRSFSPDEPSYIKFFSPLTLIVGENGCGKTTLIECLKYACTGETPPNSKGGAFVNDPRLSGLNEVKAQIKLKFNNVNGERMVCTRSLAVYLKKSTITQKTIDNTLLRYDSVTNEPHSISSRCADMDAELPLHLGVPKAILDNVVFCHQEDSNWPFQEPSNLKKKFDDIFSSKKYQVALDNIKEIRKEKAQEIVIGNTRLEAMKADTVKARKIRTTLTQMNQQAEAKNQSLETIEAKIQRVGERVRELNDVFREIDLTEDQIQQIVNKKDFYQSTLNSLEAHITPRTESTGELKKLLEQHRASQSDSEAGKAKINNDKIRLERQLKRTQEELSKKHLLMGRLEAAREQHEHQIQLRVELIRKTNEEHNMHLPVDDGEKTASVLRKNLKLCSLKNEKAKDEAMNLQNSLSDDIQLLKSQLLSIQENKKHLLSRIEQDKSQINTVQKRIQEFKVSTLEINSTKGKITEYEEKLRKMNESNNMDTNQEELTKKERELRDMDEKVSELNDELASLSKQGDIRAKLSLKRSDKESRVADMERLYNNCIRDVERLLGTKPTIDTIEHELHEYKTDKEKKLRVLIERRNASNRELSAAEAKLNMVEQTLRAKQNEAKDYGDRVKQVCGDRSVPEEIKVTEVKIEQIKERRSNLNAVDLVYDKYIDASNEGKCCPLCIRGFDDVPEFNEFLEKLQQKKKDFPTLKAQLDASLKKYNARLERLKSVQGSWIKLESLRKDIASVEATVKAYSEAKEKAMNKFDVASAEQVEVDDYKIKADRLLIMAGNISRINKEIKVIDDEIDTIETELSITGSTRTISDCQKDLEDLGDKSKLVRRDIKRIHSEMDTARRLSQAIENQIRDSREKLLGLEHKLDYKVSLEYQLEEYKEQMAEHKKSYESYDTDIEPLKEKVQETTEKYDEAVRQWRVTEEAASNEERTMSRIVERIEEYNNQIARNQLATGAERVDQVKKEASDLDSQIQSIKGQINDADEQLAIIEKDDADRRGIERDLQDQIYYRQTEIDLKECEKDLAEMASRQSEYDRHKLKQEYTKASKDESLLIDQRGSIRGELAQLKDQIKRYETELQSDYADVDGKYGRLFIEVKTNELATSDLEKYSRVLQTAIMKYHSLKMDDLNKIIKELWISTYRGGDIDYIAIRADNEGTTKSQSFNYRVVMVQSGSEVNMRGRCSAGQKVLASIIIRLALAETFCINCGIFTLDEPTTNLDKSNVESLAENLKDIIQNRRNQSNFQFVIITHDEEFARHLGGTNQLDSFYRISKDDGLHSTIKIQQMNDTAILE